MLLLCYCDVLQAMWKRMKTHTPEAHHLISKLHLTQTQYEDILRLNHAVSPAQQTTASMAEAACQWVHNNKRIWQTWVPKNLSNKTRIYLGGMFPVTGPFVRQPGIVPGEVARIKFEYHPGRSYEQGLSQWEKTLLCNVFSHWLKPCLCFFSWAEALLKWFESIWKMYSAIIASS